MKKTGKNAKSAEQNDPSITEMLRKCLDELKSLGSRIEKLESSGRTEDCYSKDDNDTTTYTLDESLLSASNGYTWNYTLNDVDRNAIAEIVEGFGFDRVHIAMTALGWTWGGSDGTPTTTEIKKLAVDLLIRSVAERTCISTGGLETEFYEDDESSTGYGLGLKFVGEEWIP